MPKISLVATDLDGTLFYDRERITARDRDMLARLRASDVILAFATGREMRLVLPAMDRLALWDDPLHIIHSGGSGIYHVAQRLDRSLAALSAQTLREIFRKYEQLPLSFLLMQDDVMHTNRITPILQRESELLRCPLVEAADFSALLTQPNSKLVVCGAEDDLESCLPLLTADTDPRYQFHRSHDLYIDCYVRGVDKGTALLALCAELGVPPEETLAIGDNLNDVQLLAAAGYSACPGDAHPAVPALVDFVACPAYEGAFADACSHFIFHD